MFKANDDTTDEALYIFSSIWPMIRVSYKILTLMKSVYDFLYSTT